MARLWGRAHSVGVMKVTWLLGELDLSYNFVDVGGDFGKVAHAKVAEINPNGKIPIWEEDCGFVVWESNAILRYLAGSREKFLPIWPSNPQGRAKVDQWMDWQQTTLHPPMNTVFYGMVRRDPRRLVRAVLQPALIRCGELWSLLDHELSGRPYIAGSDFTLADIVLGVYAHRWFSFKIEKPGLPNLRRWYERLSERPSFDQWVGGEVR